MERPGLRSTADWLSLTSLSALASVCPEVATTFRTSAADGRDTYGAVQGFRLPTSTTRGSRRAIGAKGPRPLERRSLTLSRAGSVWNEEVVSTLAWLEVRP